MIVNAGLNLIRDVLSGTADKPSHIAVGTGTTAAASGDTALETEVDRIPLTAQKQGGTGALEYVTTLDSTEANGNSLSEVGVLNASSGGALLMRETHTPYTKTSSFSVKYVISHVNTNV